MLASKSVGSGTYIATRIPGTSCIVVDNRKSYSKNLAQLGFQFERFMTGKDMSDTEDTSSVDHLHTMRVGAKTVLFVAEVDATDENDCPVEIKTSDPSNWSLRVIFQMISNGSANLCQGEKEGWGVKKVSMKSLSSVAEFSLQSRQWRDIKTLEKNILDGMNELASQIKDVGMYRLNFCDKSLELFPESDLLQCCVLPAENIVRQLITRNA